MSLGIQVSPIKYYSGFLLPFPSGLPAARAGHCKKISMVMTGEAPKDFLRIYRYGYGRKRNASSWQAYIAKVGQKAYPTESITEHLLTRLGEALGVEVAQSQLMWVKGQLRFLSKYFLKPGERLLHGAQIFASHFGNDLPFVEDVEKRKQSRNVFTFQVVHEALRGKFPGESDQILKGFVSMLAFDAIVGNNDRHYYNWGVVQDLADRRPPRFSPVFDTARALFWNSSEERLAEVSSQMRTNQFIESYIENSRPKTGWGGVTSAGHFELIHLIFRNYPQCRELLQKMARIDLLKSLESLLAQEFKMLLSPLRSTFVLQCVKQRFDRFKKSC